MALNKDVLGTALYNARLPFMDMDMDAIIAAHGTLEAYRLAIAKADADAIISHFKTAGEGKYIAGSLQAGANVVTPNGTVNMTLN